MPAPKGNQFWKARAKSGRDKIFKTPEIMWDSACEYFQWVEDNPLEKAIVYQGEVSKDGESLMRAMTVKGLCIFWGVNTDYLTDFIDNLKLDAEVVSAQNKEFSRVIKTIREIIDTQKFEGASAGLLNPNIIARDLGLTDKQATELTGKGGGSIKTDQTTRIVFKPVGKKG
jgi:hypothetical protein